ncbi:hypothetical protein WKW79_14325 [Variovorax robiniae]|uniref:Uncharacterized protein n=1 Tax=Variovorax robiniae TaxID=1836199 RepID=A0ABU8X808_9BURK
MPPASSDQSLLLVDNEFPVRWLRRLRLVPPNSLGILRRAIVLALLSWLPIVIWSTTMSRMGGEPVAGESLLRHYGVHVRCLLAIPLLIVAEVPLQNILQQLIHQFRASEIVTTGPNSAFDRLIDEVRKVRDLTVPWIIVLGGALAWAVASQPSVHDDTMIWAVDTSGKLGFGGWWFAYVANSIYTALVLAWLWRILLVTWCFWRIGRLDLSIVPTHPDRAGGLGFLDKLPRAFGLVGFVLSATISSRWAHEIVVHGTLIGTFQLPALLFAGLWTLYLLMPLLVLTPAMFVARERALPDYGALVGKQGRLVHRRWIKHEEVEDETIIEAPGIGVMADAAAMYDAASKMRFAPVSVKVLLQILVPIAVPFIVVASFQIPLGQMLLKLGKAIA